MSYAHSLLSFKLLLITVVIAVEGVARANLIGLMVVSAKMVSMSLLKREPLPEHEATNNRVVRVIQKGFTSN